MKLSQLYLSLCVFGAVVPCCWFVPWVAANGFNVPLLLSELFSTRIGAFFGMDVVMSSLVLFVFMGTEGRRLGIRSRWLAALATLLVGVSLGLPLFLYLREVRLERQQAATPSPS